MGNCARLWREWLPDGKSMRSLAAWAVCLGITCSAPAGETNGLVILLTDYGEKDHYLGTIKGSVYSVFPKARVDSITNLIEPFNVRQGAYLLSQAAPEFPKGTVFVVVVDPGVGTSRKAIVAKTTDGNYFVAPDNGLLSFVIARLGLEAMHEITNPKLLRKDGLSGTFHGRDIFGPVGAHLASGVDIKRVGPPLKDWIRLEEPQPKLEDKVLLGEIIRADTYGNLVSNITQKLVTKVGLKRGDLLSVRIGKAELKAKLMRTYGDVPKGQPLCLIESLGRLEISVNMGSMAKRIGQGPGAPVRVQKAEAE